MAEAVKLALKNSACLIVEAGTGVGKTLAYLIPMPLYYLSIKYVSAGAQMKPALAAAGESLLAPHSTRPCTTRS